MPSVQLRPGDIAAIAARIQSAQGADAIARVQALRSEVKQLCQGEQVPALSREEYANALVTLAGGAPVAGAAPVAVRSSIDAADRAVVDLQGAVRVEKKTIA